jgi:hypothetical protein
MDVFSYVWATQPDNISYAIIINHEALIQELRNWRPQADVKGHRLTAYPDQNYLGRRGWS